MSNTQTTALTKAPPPPEVVQKKEAASFLESEQVLQALAKIGAKHATPDRIARVAITSVMGKPQLVQAAAHVVGRASLLNCLMRCTQMGLEPDGRLVHLVPFWNSKEKCYEVQLIVDYKGLLTLAKDNGIDAKAMLVHASDTFSYLEDDGQGKTVVHHQFDPFTERGAIIGVYSRARESEKAPDYEFMSITEVEAIRKRSRAGDNGPWQTDYGEMVKKTVIRRHSKRWPLRPDIREAFNADDDTPTFGTTTVAAPIFGRKQGELSAGAPPAENPPAAPEPPTKGEPPAAAQTLAEQLTELSARRKVKPEDMLQYLLSTGMCDQGVESYQLLVEQYPDIATDLVAQFEEVATELAKSKKAGK